MKNNKIISEIRRLISYEGADAYLVPMKNNFLNDDLNTNEMRIKFLTNFSGSAGLALIAINNNCIFVDGRYTTQAKLEVDPNLFQIDELNFQKQIDWLKSNLKSNSVIGFDSRLHSIDEVEKYNKGLKELNITLKSIKYNLVDKIWKNRSLTKKVIVSQHKLEYSGIECIKKLTLIRKKYLRNQNEAIFCQDKDFISWLTNLRAYKKKYTPSIPAVTIITRKHCYLFLDEVKIPLKNRVNIDPFIKICDINSFSQNLLAACDGIDFIRLDKKYVSYFYFNKFRQLLLKINHLEDLTLEKASKNELEIKGMLKANIQDAVAICKLLYWIKYNCEKSTLDEVIITKKSKEIRKHNSKEYLGPSFPAIVGFKENSAIIHYSASKRTNKLIDGDGILLLDSGGQYKFGTTDITRSILIGNASIKMIELYTITLKAHIALCTLQFNDNFTGRDLDLVARNIILRYGYNYNHGTGHGVGSVLSVHEGPQSISPKDNNKYFKEGMIFSNEPGIYLENEFGIRIENLMLLKKVKDKQNKDNMYFEIISFAPFEKDLIDKKLLDQKEVTWINNYHSLVRKKLITLFDKKEAAWIKKVTSKI
ncbi:MAG: aminopeptidase family protein P [Hyphomicrobiales bacterium]|nr:aminopeptidase family protein P [Hyphomicrobiales bacterium]